MPSHVLIVRACAEDPDGASVELRAEYDQMPSGEDVRSFTKSVREGFTENLGRPPERWGVAILPFVTDIDRRAE